MCSVVFRLFAYAPVGLLQDAGLFILSLGTERSPRRTSRTRSTCFDHAGQKDSLWDRSFDLFQQKIVKKAIKGFLLFSTMACRDSNATLNCSILYHILDFVPTTLLRARFIYTDFWNIPDGSTYRKF